MEKCEYCNKEISCYSVDDDHKIICDNCIIEIYNMEE